MSTLATATWRAALLGRWTARIAGTLFALFFLVFLVGEGPPPLLKLNLQQSLQFLGMAGLVAGLILAWKWEGWGGALSLASFVLLLSIDRRFNTSWMFLAPALAACLHIASSWRLHAGPPETESAWKVSQPVLWVAAAVVGAFILLCANEILCNPPLMTTNLQPSAGLVGTWRETAGAPAFELRIAPDATASWEVADLTIAGARIYNNRSWFGQMMNWREPYIVRAGDSTILLSVKGRRLDGVWLQPHGTPYRLDLEKQ
jgi:hypothetical protein